MLARKFGRNVSTYRSTTPIEDAKIAAVAPSIFAREAHASRSERYTYIPTADVLAGLRKEGFQPFFVAQTQSRDDTRRDFTKHMIRLRHASQVNAAEANEIILLNSHDGTSSYQMLAGMLRFVCTNGLVCGKDIEDLRIPHKGNVVDRVIEGAYTVLDRFERVDHERDEMKALTLSGQQQVAFAQAALSLRYENEDKTPVTFERVLFPRRVEDNGADMWRTFNRVQENLTRGGQPGHDANFRRVTTRAVNGMDSNLKLNRALWTLGQEMVRLLRGEAPSVTAEPVALAA